MQSESPAPRGRPRSASPADINPVALRVLFEDGYRTSTMQHVASKLGISSRTLHRYFTSKAEIVWWSLREAHEALRQRLDEIGTRPRDPVSGIAEAVVDLVAQGSDGSGRYDVLRMRFALIGDNPELRAATSEPTLLWRSVLTEYCRACLSSDESDPRPEMVAAAAESVTTSALIWWARNEQNASPTQSMSEAFDFLRAGLRVEDH
ncbi:TetR/AcrR family transcriptional regulator [Herbiconiux sp. P15]|uniref:TetR/AcrR family transcriptional regulator n=1 Tax=Herbiconiux liukaitaii TaxID=3342799 RepID=UPI0035B6FAE2